MISWEQPNIGGGANSVTEYLVRWNNMSMNVQNALAASISNLQSNTLYTVMVSARGSDKALGAKSNISVTTSKRDAAARRVKLLKLCLACCKYLEITM